MNADEAVASWTPERIASVRRCVHGAACKQSDPTRSDRVDEVCAVGCAPRVRVELLDAVEVLAWDRRRLSQRLASASRLLDDLPLRSEVTAAVGMLDAALHDDEANMVSGSGPIVDWYEIARRVRGLLQPSGGAS